MFTGETNIEEKFDFDRTDVEMASQAIHRTIELEPDNTFYNYLLAHLLFGQKRDDEALRSLWKATRKSYCNMHRREGVSARIRLLEVAGLPGLEVKAETLPAMLLPHLSLLRHIARLATSLGVEYQKKGEHDRAIDVYQSVFEMGRKIREGAWLIIDELVGIAIESIPAHNFSPEEEELAGIKDWEEKRERRLKLTNERFRKYLMEHGKWEFAKRFQEEIISGQAYVERARAYTGEFQTKGFLWALGAWGLTMLSGYCFHQSILYLILFTILLLLWPYFSWRTPIKWNYKKGSIFIFVAVFMKTCQNTPSLDGDEWHPCQGVIRGKDVPLSLLCKDAPPLGGVLHFSLSGSFTFLVFLRKSPRLASLSYPAHSCISSNICFYLCFFRAEESR